MSKQAFDGTVEIAKAAISAPNTGTAQLMLKPEIFTGFIQATYDKLNAISKESTSENPQRVRTF